MNLKVPNLVVLFATWSISQPRTLWQRKGQQVMAATMQNNVTPTIAPGLQELESFPVDETRTYHTNGEIVDMTSPLVLVLVIVVVPGTRASISQPLFGGN
jgi:hypothetical protein